MFCRRIFPPQNVVSQMEETHRKGINASYIYLLHANETHFAARRSMHTNPSTNFSHFRAPIGFIFHYKTKISRIHKFEYRCTKAENPEYFGIEF